MRMAKRNPGTSFASWLQERFVRFASGIGYWVDAGQTVESLIRGTYQVKEGASRLLSTAINFVNNGRAAVANILAGTATRGNFPVDPNVPPKSAYRVWVVVAWETDGEPQGMTIPTDFASIPTAAEIEARALELANQKANADPRYPLKEELTKDNASVTMTIATRRTR